MQGNDSIVSSRPDTQVHLRIKPCIIKGCEVTRSEIATNLRPNFNKREYTRGRAHLIISELGYLTTNPPGNVKSRESNQHFDMTCGGFVINSILKIKLDV